MVVPQFFDRVQKRAFSRAGEAVSLVVATAWAEAFAALVDHWFPSEDVTLARRFLYAIMFTVVASVVFTFLPED